jgi:hypothetical protein
VAAGDLGVVDYNVVARFATDGDGGLGQSEALPGPAAFAHYQLNRGRLRACWGIWSGHCRNLVSLVEDVATFVARGRIEVWQLWCYLRWTMMELMSIAPKEVF